MKLFLITCMYFKEATISTSNDEEGFANAIEKLYESEELRQRFGRRNLDLVKEYSLDKVKKEMEEIYYQQTRMKR